MKRTNRANQRGSLSASMLTLTAWLAAFGMAGLLGAGQSLAQETDAECAQTCSVEFKDCMGEAKGGFRQCRVDEGCVDLRAEARQSCRGEVVDEELCTVIRDELRGCNTLCRQTVHAELSLCRQDGQVCLSEDCGLELRRPNRVLRRGRMGRR